jgi:hypothetical protein
MREHSDLINDLNKIEGYKIKTQHLVCIPITNLLIEKSGKQTGHDGSNI